MPASSAYFTVWGGEGQVNICEFSNSQYAEKGGIFGEGGCVVNLSKAAASVIQSSPSR
jgi:hypothetical protein